MEYVFSLTSSNYRHVRFSSIISGVTKKNKYLSYRSPSEVESAITKGYFLLAFEKEKLAGWIERMQIWKNWWGLFSLYVIPAYRKKGVGTRLLESVTLIHKNDFIYVATYNSWVEKKLEFLGYKRISRSKLPLSFLWNILKKRFLNFGLIYNFPLIRNPYRYFVHRNKLSTPPEWGR